jgi:hypothetical protein
MAHVAELINQTAAEVTAAEDQLRSALIALIRRGDTGAAIAILDDWQKLAAVELIAKHPDLQDAQA